MLRREGRAAYYGSGRFKKGWRGSTRDPGGANSGGEEEDEEEEEGLGPELPPELASAPAGDGAAKPVEEGQGTSVAFLAPGGRSAAAVDLQGVQQDP